MIIGQRNEKEKDVYKSLALSLSIFSSVNKGGNDVQFMNRFRMHFKILVGIINVI